jgi:hypothetical protein
VPLDAQAHDFCLQRGSWIEERDVKVHGLSVVAPAGVMQQQRPGLGVADARPNLNRLGPAPRSREAKDLALSAYYPHRFWPSGE